MGALIERVEIDQAVPWAPHSGTSFRIKRKPEEVLIKKLKRPKVFDYEKDYKGEPMRWHMTATNWNRLYEGERAAAEAQEE